METRVQRHLDGVAQLHISGAIPLASVILFGSAATDAFSQTSDVDLILVVPDGTSQEDRRLLRAEVTELEIAHGFRVAASRRPNALERYAEHAGGHEHACFLCTRADLLSGDVARIFGLRGAEAVFVERMFLASVMVSARTAWGEDLLSLVPIAPLRRLDVLKSLFRSTAFTLFCAAAFPALPDATKYAMSTLKHSLHSCYFCYYGKTAPLNDEVIFFNARVGRDRTLQDLLNQRKEYHRSFAFVLRCVRILFRVHLRTLRDNQFPRVVARA
ncbi:MAG TPA: nucleotidyltransferase domain-containing protein [Terracidiphilus sp.]|jgi:predicted nucleotidyltransferase|nr:nucleotidyltransferase domain-containing protein [Terracidiphilus sp.]